MRRLLYILLTAVALTLVMGCSRSVDKRLVLADTLMWSHQPRLPPGQREPGLPRPTSHPGTVPLLHSSHQ